MKEVIDQNLWNFELGPRENIKNPKWIIIGFQQLDRRDSRSLNNDTFCRLPVTSTQAVIGTEKNHDSANFSNSDDDEYSQGYSRIKEAFRALTKDDTLQQNISYDNFRSSNIRADDGFNFYVFDIRYQKNYAASQPNRVEFKFVGVIGNDINGYALVLTNKLVSISSDGHRNFGLIYS